MVCSMVCLLVSFHLRVLSPIVCLASTAESIGIDRHPPIPQKVAKDEWSYASLASPPPSHPESQQWASSIYQGLVPAKNIAMRDFAINGAVVRGNFVAFYSLSLLLYPCSVISLPPTMAIPAKSSRIGYPHTFSTIPCGSHRLQKQPWHTLRKTLAGCESGSLTNCCG